MLARRRGMVAIHRSCAQPPVKPSNTLAILPSVAANLSPRTGSSNPSPSGGESANHWSPPACRQMDGVRREPDAAVCGLSQGDKTRIPYHPMQLETRTLPARAPEIGALL